MQMILCIVSAYKSWNTSWNQWGLGLQNQNLNDKDLQNKP